jgi:large subunit ribosomal protein L17
MFRNMVTSLLEHGVIRTTDAKAKELRKVAAKMITLGKKGTLHHKRIAAQTIRSRAVLVKLFDEIAPGFTERQGGYTRIVKLGNRSGDAAAMAQIELMPPGAPVVKPGRRPTMAPTLKTSAGPVATKETFDSE